MAHYVGKILKIRPSEILDEWSVPELIVAFGQYQNEESNLAFTKWEYDHGTKSKTKPERPQKYAVFFMQRPSED